MGLCFEDEYNQYHESLLKRFNSDEVQIPGIWPAEVGNVLTVAERRQRITPADSQQFIALLRDLPIHVVTMAGLDGVPGIISVAQQYSVSFYDAQYLHLALETGASLATLDGDLARAAREAGIKVI